MLFVHSEGAVAEILVGINLCGSLHSPRFILSDSWKRTAITKVRAHVRKLSVPYCAAFIVLDLLEKLRDVRSISLTTWSTLYFAYHRKTNPVESQQILGVQIYPWANRACLHISESRHMPQHHLTRYMVNFQAHFLLGPTFHCR
ncbi:hypothetical protein Y032_0080g1390 [Ancylostoma ceylanicum]|nr:hypothetical protein Y032_0080g1390 [Ancylostoma ceylanicum]